MSQSGARGFTRQNHKEVSGGFTLVEIVIAMGFFTFILMFITTGFIVVNRAYNQGITVKLVQGEARRTVDMLTREIRSSSVVAVSSGVDDCIMLNGDSYYWFVPVDSQDVRSPMRLIMARDTSCLHIDGLVIDENNPPLGEDLLHGRVGVQHMEVSRLADGGNSTPFYRISLTLSTAATDLLDEAGINASCAVEISGSQYCDIVRLNTVVSTR